MELSLVDTRSTAYSIGVVSSVVVLGGLGAALIAFGVRRRRRAKRAWVTTQVADVAHGATVRAQKRTGFIPITIGALILLAAPVKLDLYLHARSGQLHTGDCVSAAGLLANNTPDRATTCDGEDGLYEVASITTNANCPDNLPLENSPYVRLDDGSTRLCLAFAPKETKCYTATPAGSGLWTHSGCTEPTPLNRIRITKVIEGSNNRNDCPAGDTALTYPLPVRLICWQSD